MGSLPGALNAPARSRPFRAALRVAIVVALFYSLLIFVMLQGRNHDFRDFARIGERFIQQGSGSTVIVPDPTFRYYQEPEHGYDGQTAYFIALDPLNAAAYLDNPPYRFTRILYPLLARLLSGGLPWLIPFTLVAINVAAAALGAGGLAFLAVLWNRSPWWALAYGFHPGLIYGITRDLTEPLAYGLVIAAIVAAERQRSAAAVLFFTLAVLTRETTVVFPAAYFVLSLVRHHSFRRAAAYTVPGIAGVLWQLVIHAEFGQLGVRAGPSLAPWPYAGALQLMPWDAAEWRVMLLAVVPVSAAALIALISIRRQPLFGGLVLANSVLFTMLAPAASFEDFQAAARIILGAVVSLLLLFLHEEFASRQKQRVVHLLILSLWAVAGLLVVAREVQSALLVPQG
jgi:hypothetical protein